MICALGAAATDAARPPTTAALADSMRSANSSTATLHFALPSSSGVAWRRRALQQRRGAVCRLLAAQANAKANLRIFLLLICAVCEDPLLRLFASAARLCCAATRQPVDGCTAALHGTKKRSNCNQLKPIRQIDTRAPIFWGQWQQFVTFCDVPASVIDTLGRTSSNTAPALQLAAERILAHRDVEGYCSKPSTRPGAYICPRRERSVAHLT